MRREETTGDKSKMLAESVDLSDRVLDDRGIIRSTGDAGFTVTPEKTVSELIEDAYESLGKQKMKSRRQKLIRAPSDLITKLNEVAKGQGKTLYSYVTEIFEQAVRACEMQRDLKEIVDNFEILEVHKEGGTTFTPRNIMDYLASIQSVSRKLEELDKSLTTLLELLEQRSKSD